MLSWTSEKVTYCCHTFPNPLLHQFLSMTNDASPSVYKHRRSIIGRSPSYFDKPMVDARDSELVAEVVRRWADLQEVLGSNTTDVHLLV